MPCRYRNAHIRLRTNERLPAPPKSRASQTPPQETCGKSDSVLGPVKDAFKVAEQSAYEYFSHFSEGLREDVREVRPRPTPTLSAL